ncbi:MbnP family protein [Rubrivirga sp.]|uniref:MbnP family protein n=1 Tax=Rubrivirga sp. TaxID=1885344 RepID=UPI003C72C2A4
MSRPTSRTSHAQGGLCATPFGVDLEDGPPPFPSDRPLPVGTIAPVWHGPSVPFSHACTPMTLRTLAPTGALLLALVVAGCDSSDTTSSDPATVRLDVQTMADGADLAAGQPFAVNGTTGQLDIAHLYLSGITLLHEDGREIMVMADEPVTVRAKDDADTDIQHTLDQRYVLVDADAGRQPTTLGEVPSGRYTGVRMLLGVQGLDNRIAPEDAPVDHPLAPQTPSMHWNWNAGFVFLRLDGLLDIDGDGAVDAATDTPGDPASGQWRLHVGLSPNATTVTLDQDFELMGGQMQDLHVMLDLGRLVQGIDYADPANRFCMTGGCQGVVDQATANAQTAFTLQGVRGLDM